MKNPGAEKLDFRRFFEVRYSVLKNKDNNNHHHHQNNGNDFSTFFYSAFTT